MTNQYSLDDLVDFLDHTRKKGLMPAATAQALAVASRNVLGVLDNEEQENIAGIDIDAAIKRFNNKRAKDFNPASLKVYGSRVRRAIELFEQWKTNPAEFSVKTRNSSPRRTSTKLRQYFGENDEPTVPPTDLQNSASRPGTFQSSCPVGPGRVITLTHIPEDLTSNEAAKLANFVKMLAVDSKHND
jgi:hypothetical protein